MKKGIIIGILAIAVIVIAGCTQQVRESTTPREISRQSYGADYQGVLDMLNNCQVYHADGGRTCNSQCEITSQTCVSAEVEYTRIRDGEIRSDIIECEAALDVPDDEEITDHTCVCCSP